MIDGDHRSTITGFTYNDIKSLRCAGNRHAVPTEFSLKMTPRAVKRKGITKTKLKTLRLNCLRSSTAFIKRVGRGFRKQAHKLFTLIQESEIAF